MVEIIKPFAEWCSAIIEAFGIGIIAAFAVYSIVMSIVRLLKRRQINTIIKEGRQNLGRGLLAGLEFLVASDIIHTVAVNLTFETIGVLSIIVLIRTFLSFTLELELTGHVALAKRKKILSNQGSMPVELE
ncbi:hypothetical protein ANSO36C_02490 [Nostoc cf. commune SO-36]|uniref:DUF1622 domain-containing protein n=1 Tax=Nostoc cf. commune SO-36 TaxID=449208 RepID=A0ABM7YUZ5_NOSCO|nr:DUF1622 domain-containing protein [Nostoc commune]BDI14447.1 hypothetical protein ANSO36C_02490 [Nostoc cf. commune SO-36]